MNKTKKHIEAIEERICEYINAEESGTGDLPSCSICESVSYGIWKDCKNCLLQDHETAINISSLCCSKVREEIDYRLSDGHFESIPKDLLKKRRKELIESVNRNLKK